jgi:hypothetical protein
MSNLKSSHKQEDAVITDKKELTAIQDELIEKTDGKFIKPPKPKGAKYTRREITRNMAICLIFVYKHYKYSESKLTDYFPKRVLLQYLNEYPNITRYFNRLKYWDLIAQMPTSPTEVIYKKGWYGITENGIAFIQQEIALPKYAFIYNDYAYEHKPIPLMITDLISKSELEDLLKP